MKTLYKKQMAAAAIINGIWQVFCTCAALYQQAYCGWSNISTIAAIAVYAVFNTILYFVARAFLKELHELAGTK